MSPRVIDVPDLELGLVREAGNARCDLGAGELGRDAD